MYSSQYPLTKENLNAVLEHYFPSYELGPQLDRTLKDLKDNGKITMIDIEVSCNKAYEHIHLLEGTFYKNPTRTMLLEVALAAFFHRNWNNLPKAPNFRNEGREILLKANDRQETKQQQIL